jgi:signal transduction histidine kinase
VRLHGGTIEAHSEGRGKGSEFVVRLPLERSAIADGSAIRGKAAEPAS